MHPVPLLAETEPARPEAHPMQQDGLIKRLRFADNVNGFSKMNLE